MFNNDKPIKPILFDNLDAVFDEKGSTFLTMRKVQWCEEGKEPNEEKAKLELRKWRIDKDGQERADKGFAFLTEEGPHELTKVLIHNGYGHTKDILNEIKVRDDFVESVKNLDSDNVESEEGEFFDMRDLLLNIDKETEGEED